MRDERPHGAPAEPPGPPNREDAPDGDGEVTIEVSVAALDGEITLDGQAASSQELLRARHTVDLLRGILPRLSDTADAAQVSYEIGTLLGWPLEQLDGALETMREAYQRKPTSIRYARGYRKAAMRSGDARELATALENEATLARANTTRAVLNIRRAEILERELDNAEAARFSYLLSLDADPQVEALDALERLAVTARDWPGAAGYAERIASLVTDTTIRAEHLARAARHLTRSGDSRGALALAVQARVHAPASASISFALERLLTADGTLAELASLRERQIEAGFVDPVEAWFDAGVLLRYRVGDSERAIRAFRAAADAAGEDDARKAACLEQLALALEQEGRWHELVEVDKRRLRLCDGHDKARCWQRVATTYDERIGDPALAAQAYDFALAADPTWAPALEGAGRLAHAAGRSETEARSRLLRMHRLEADAATSSHARGDALRRLGELLIEDAETLDEGVEVLREAHGQLPKNLAVLRGLERALHKKGAWKMLVDLYEHQLESEEDASRRGWLLAQMGLIAADQLGDHARAVRALEEYLAIGASHPSIPLMRLAALLEDGGDDDTLVAVLAKIADQTSGVVERASILSRIAAVRERQGRLDEAISAFEDAIAIAPSTHPVYADAGRAYLRAGRYDELSSVLLAGSRHGEDSERAHWLVRAAHVMDRRLGRTNDAIESLKQAAALDPSSLEARATLEHILLRERRWEELTAHFTTSDDDPADADRLLCRATVAEAIGDPEAVVWYRRALDAGQSLAWLPYARLAAPSSHWEELERRYASCGGSSTARHHARYRAGEIAIEHLGARERGITHWLASHEADKGALAPLVALARLTDPIADAVDILASLQASTRDAAIRMLCLRRRIAELDRAGQRDEALATRLDVLSLLPSEPWVLAEVEIELERRGDRVALADVLRAAAADTQLEPGLVESTQAALGAVLEQLGSLGDAVVAYESAQEPGGPPQRATLLGLRRCYDAIEDDRVGQVLAELAACPPVGPEQALSRRALAWWWMEHGNADIALSTLESALRAHPCDYDALNDLAEIAGDEASTRVTDAMVRAFELEQDSELSLRLGLALVTRLLRDRRIEAAREAVERLRDLAPDHLRVLIVHEELQEQRNNWEGAAAALERIATHDDAPGAVRVEALLRLAAIQKDELDAAEAAKETTKRLLSLDASRELGARVRLDVEEALGDHAAAATSLDELTKSDDLGDGERGGLLLRLAALQDEQLGDPRAALATLSRITDRAGRELAAKRLSALGERDGRWEVTCDALEATLNGSHRLDPLWEAALRRRLGDLLLSRLNKPEAALRHYEKVVELDPRDTITLLALADIAATQSADLAVAFHKKLLAVDPQRASSYRALRQLFLQLEQTDGAFCAEAMLVGLNAADDEERYFYRQRRMSLTQKLTSELGDGDLDLLFPDREAPAIQLFAALDVTLPALFGVDRTAYGIDEHDESSSRILGPVATAVARLLGVASHALWIASPQICPTAELGDPPLVIMPRALEDALRREQQFVCGAILGRVRFRGIGADPCRFNALDGRQIEHLLAAACNLAGVPLDTEAAEGAIYEDVKKRLGELLSGDTRREVDAAARRYVESGIVTGDSIIAAHLDASLRTAILAAQDPSVAVRCLRMFGAMFGSSAAPGTIPSDLARLLPFSISDEHLQLRVRLSSVGGATST